MSMAHVDAQGSHVVVFTPGSNQYNYTTVVEGTQMILACSHSGF